MPTLPILAIDGSVLFLLDSKLYDSSNIVSSKNSSLQSRYGTRRSSWAEGIWFFYPVS